MFLHAAAAALAGGSPPRSPPGVLPSWFTPERRDLLSSTYRHLYIAEGVIPSAAAARRVFDENFASPREAHAERFVWDYWHVTHRDEDAPRRRPPPSPQAQAAGEESGEGKAQAGEARGAKRKGKEEEEEEEEEGRGGALAGLEEAVAAAAACEASSGGGYGRSAAASHGSGQQYTMLRAAAAEYFPPALFEALCVEITEYGREQLGCDAITPPWLALYTDGCSQNFHTDAPHGPFAFVLSLTPPGAYAPQDGSAPGWFEGGETTILKPSACDYWRGFDARRGLEFHSLFDVVAPRWGRLTVFDARLPHGVAAVRGTRDPRRARLVLTGWFSSPQPTVRGGLAAGGEEAALRVVAEACAQLEARVDGVVSRVVGFVAVRLGVKAEDGAVASLESLCDTLVADPADRQGPIGEDGEGGVVYDDGAEDIRVLLHHVLSSAVFPAADADSSITVPFSFS
ncbi:hypothetical protein AB1Y20_010384 [Prymnesium parvum]|uniref:Fe2OG dioxygenase domain-containing protein n=1 Tax=Prymnesium parvum TaxID=97485 RepID=A0AB34IP49_PRYPA